MQLTLLSVNYERIAGALLRGELNLGFVEGRSKSRGLHYELLLLPDELAASLLGIVPIEGLVLPGSLRRCGGRGRLLARAAQRFGAIRRSK